MSKVPESICDKSEQVNYVAPCKPMGRPYVNLKKPPMSENTGCGAKEVNIILSPLFMSKKPRFHFLELTFKYFVAFCPRESFVLAIILNCMQCLMQH